MASEERPVLACTPAHWRREDHIPGTVQIDGDCGHRIDIAPSGMALVKAENAKTTCIPCALTNEEFVAMVKKQRATITSDQRNELNDAMGVGEVDQMIAELNLNTRGEE